jgi:hypothetical protein
MLDTLCFIHCSVNIQENKTDNSNDDNHDDDIYKTENGNVDLSLAALHTPPKTGHM